MRENRSVPPTNFERVRWLSVDECECCRMDSIGKTCCPAIQAEAQNGACDRNCGGLISLLSKHQPALIGISATILGPVNDAS